MENEYRNLPLDEAAKLLAEGYILEEDYNYGEE